MVKHKKNELTFYILPIFLFAAAFVILLLTLYPYYLQSPRLPKSQVLTPTVVPTVSPTSPVWRTYRSDKFGFEFKYLSNISLDESVSDKLWLTLSTFSVVAEKKNSHGSDSFKTLPKIKTVVINNIVWDIYHSNKGGGDHGEGERNAYIATNNTYQYTFYGFNSDSKSTIEDILSSFKFSPITTPTQTTSNFTCPKTDWIDCEPGPGSVKPMCQTEYLQWATINCPDFKGAAL